MVEPERTPNGNLNGSSPDTVSRDPLARALSFTPSFQLIRQEWELGNLLRDTVDAARTEAEQSEKSSQREAELKSSVSSYLTDGSKNLNELDRRLARIPGLLAESRRYTQSFAASSDAVQSNETLPPHVQTLIAREAGLAIFKKLVSDALLSCEGTSKETFISRFYAGILEDLKAVSTLDDTKRAEPLLSIVDGVKDDATLQQGPIGRAIASIEENVAVFVSRSLNQLQKIQNLAPSELFSIAPLLHAEFQQSVVPQCQELSEQLQLYLDDANAQLNVLRDAPEKLSECITWFQLSLDALADERSDLMRELENFCVELVQQTEDFPELAHDLLGGSRRN